jgi:hypothetical protein
MLLLPLLLLLLLLLLPLPLLLLVLLLLLADQLSKLPDVHLLLAPEALHEQAQQLQQQLNTTKAADSDEIQLQLVPVITIAAAEEPPHQLTSSQQQLEQQQQEEQQQQLLFDFVAVGGTFDRLHAGHRLLLAATALVCKQQVYAGITGEGGIAIHNDNTLHTMRVWGWLNSTPALARNKQVYPGITGEGRIACVLYECSRSSSEDAGCARSRWSHVEFELHMYGYHR